MRYFIMHVDFRRWQAEIILWGVGREISKFWRRVFKLNIRFEANPLSPNVTAELEVRACSISFEVIYIKQIY